MEYQKPLKNSKKICLPIPSKRAVPKDWVNVQDDKPEPYALVLMRLKRAVTVVGWWTGTNWDGRRLLPDDEVIAYKRHIELINGMQ